MDQSALVMEEIDAGAEFAREFDKYEPVKAAFWMKASDDDHRYRDIYYERIDDTNFGVAYGEVLRLAGKLQSLYFDAFRVKLINADDPLAKAAVDVNLRLPGRMGTRFGGKMFGGISVDEVYIYPSPLPAPVS